MAFWKRKQKEPETRSNSQSVDALEHWMVRATQGYLTHAGTNIDEKSALSVGAVYSCVRIIAWTIASLPLHTFENLDERTKNKAYDHKVYTLLHDTPNPEQTAFEFRSLIIAQQLLWGAGVAEIERDPVTREVVALWPIPTYSVTPRRTPKGLLVYEVNPTDHYKPNTKIDGSSHFLWPEDVLVFPSLTSTRDTWLSPIRVHRETIGFAKALREFGSKTFGQGTNPAGIISVENPLSEEVEAELIKSLENYSGLSSAHRLMFLSAGVKFDRVGMPPQEAQYIESHQLSTREISQIYNVPLHLLNEQQGGTTWGSGLEEINSGFVSYTLNPYLVQHEQEYARKLFSNGRGGIDRRFYVKHNVEGLLRGKLLDRYEAYAKGRQHSILSPDDCRSKEDMNPIEGGYGERYDTPVNMVNVAIADDIVKKNSEKQSTGGNGDGAGKKADN